MSKYILIHYSEIGLKGRNRGFFEQKLVDNIKTVLSDFNIKVQLTFDRIIVSGNWDNDEDIKRQLSFVSGIAFYAFVSIIDWDLEKIEEEVLRLAEKKKFSSFAIMAKRSNKNYPLTSMDINRQVGRYVLDNLNDKKVDLKNPDLACYIEIANNEAMIYLDKIPGLGGLPVGTAGRLVSLISGGFDSPVASFQIMRRGAEVVFVHFHSYPNTPKASIEKVEELVKILGNYQNGSKLYLVPFLNIQKEIFAKAPEKLRVILYRRFMVRIAGEIAKKENCLGLVTGDNLGQVASQTLENMRAVEAVSNLPIYRPLIALDKNDIIKVSKKINTHDLSAEPFDDCCSLFEPKNPETRTKMVEVEKAEERLDIKRMVEETVKKTEVKM